MRNVWDRYDAEEGGSKVFTSLITALKRLVTERPALLGVCQQMFGAGVTHPGSTADGAYALDVGGVAGMVASAASATVTGMANMMSSEAGLSIQGSAMKLQWCVFWFSFFGQESDASSASSNTTDLCGSSAPCCSKSESFS